MRAFTLALAFAAMAAPLHAQQGVAVDSAVFVERSKPAPGGVRRVVEPADVLRRGDRVVTILRWDAPRGGSYTITSPVPTRLSFQKSSAEEIEVSTDGGRSWRRLDGAIVPETVTHLRWRVGRGSGRLSYSAIVR